MTDNELMFKEAVITSFVAQGADAEFFEGYFKQAEEQVDQWNTLLTYMEDITQDANYRQKLAAELLDQYFPLEMDKTAAYTGAGGWEEKIQNVLGMLGGAFGAKPEAQGGSAGGLGGALAGMGGGTILGMILASLFKIPMPIAMALGAALGGGAGYGIGSGGLGRAISNWNKPTATAAPAPAPAIDPAEAAARQANQDNVQGQLKQMKTQQRTENKPVWKANDDVSNNIGQQAAAQTRPIFNPQIAPGAGKPMEQSLSNSMPMNTGYEGGEQGVPTEAPWDTYAPQGNDPIHNYEPESPIAPANTPATQSGSDYLRMENAAAPMPAVKPPTNLLTNEISKATPPIGSQPSFIQRMLQKGISDRPSLGQQ